MDVALECDLAFAGTGKPCFRHVDHLDRLAEDAAGGFKFVLAVRNLQAAQHEYAGCIPATTATGHG